MSRPLSERELLQQQKHRLENYVYLCKTNDPRAIEQGKAILADLVYAELQTQANAKERP